MSDTSENVFEKAGSNRGENEINLLDLLIALAKHKTSILASTFVMAVVGIAFSQFLPKMYTASVTIMPPQQSQSSVGALLGQLGGLASVAGGGLGIKNPSDIYVGMLESRSVKDSLIKRFNLGAVYRISSDELLRKSLAGNTVVHAARGGFISIDYTDKDPKRAADIANAYVDELNKLTATLAVTEASQRRLFFEKQLNLVRSNLSRAEFDLQKMQEGAGFIQDYPQEMEIAESNARLRAEIAAKEVQLSAMQIGVTERNPVYLRLKQELDSLRKRLVGVEGGGDAANPKVAESSLGYIQKFREVKYNQAVMDLLFKQFEAAKMDEAKDTPLIQVLDKAIPPEHKSKPKRTFIVMVSALLGLFMSILWSLVKETGGHMGSDPEQTEKMNRLKHHLFGRKTSG